MTLPMRPLIHTKPRSKSAPISSERLVGVVLRQTYRIEEVHRTSGCSQLMHARHLRLGHRVLIKALAQKDADDDLARVRFIREATSLGRIQSPYVVTILDIAELPDGRPCFITEHLPGIDLRAFLQTQRILDALDAIDIAQDISRALVAVHETGIYHRDVKPANIVVVQTPGTTGLRASLIDFGIVAWEDTEHRITRPGAIVGTPSYMPPEQACGICADARSDVYALGAVLYRMITGRPPYAGTNPSQVLSRVREGKPRRPRSVATLAHPALCAIVERAMSRNPDDRYRTMQDMHDALATLSRQLRAGSASKPVAKPGIWRGRRSALLFVFAIVAVCATLLWLASS